MCSYHQAQRLNHNYLPSEMLDFSTYLPTKYLSLSLSLSLSLVVVHLFAMVDSHFFHN
jgi:hypothetical protein